MNHRLAGLILIYTLLSVQFIIAQEEHPLYYKYSQNGRYKLYDKYEDRIRYNIPYSIYEWKKYEKLQLAGWSKKKIEKLERKLNPKRSGAFMVIHKGKVVTAWGNYSRRFHASSIKRTFVSDVIEANKETLKEKIDPGGENKLSVETYFQEDLMHYPTKGERSRFLQFFFPLKKYESPRPYSTRKPKRVDRFGTSKNQQINELRDDLYTLTNVEVSTVFFDSIATYLRMEDFRPIDAYLHPNPTFLEYDDTPIKDFYFKISARDLARIGQMYLNDGKWRVFQTNSIDNYKYYGEWKKFQILDTMWLSHNTQSLSTSLPNLPPRVGYGYQWWINVFTDTTANFSSIGRGGQLLSVFPDHDLVIVHLGNTYSSNGISYRRLKKLVKLVFMAKEEKAETDKLPGEFLRHIFGDRLSLIPLSTKKMKEYIGEFDVLNIDAPFAGGGGGGSGGDPITKTSKTPKGEQLKIKVTQPENEKRLLMETSWMGNYYLLPIAEDVFLWEDARFRMTFVRNDGGGVSHVTIERTE